MQKEASDIQKLLPTFVPHPETSRNEDMFYAQFFQRLREILNVSCN